MQKLFQLFAWSLLLTIVALSVVPASYRPTTSASHNFEHLYIFFATGAAFALAYPKKPVILTVKLVVFAAAIECTQLWIPGRHARLIDFILDGAASSLGVLATWTFVRWATATVRGR